MQVIAFSTPKSAEWRWRIVNYGGEMVEESYGTFPSIATAVEEGTKRMREVDEREIANRPSTYHRGSRR